MFFTFQCCQVFVLRFFHFDVGGDESSWLVDPRNPGGGSEKPRAALPHPLSQRRKHWRAFSHPAAVMSHPALSDAFYCLLVTINDRNRLTKKWCGVAGCQFYWVFHSASNYAGFIGFYSVATSLMSLLSAICLVLPDSLKIAFKIKFKKLN